MNIFGITIVKGKTQSVKVENSSNIGIAYKVMPSKITRYLLVALLAFGFIGLSAILEVSLEVPTKDSVFHHITTLIQFLNELGFAFLISLIIIIALEQRTREEFEITVRDRITSIQANVFESTFGRNLPKSVISEVENLVLKADFIREDHTSSYRFRLANAQNLTKDAPSIDLLLVNVTVTYRVRNVSGIRKTYSIRPGIEKSPIPELTNQVRYEELKINDTPQPFQPKEDGNFIRLPIEVPDIGSGEIARISMRYQSIKHVRDYEIWRSLIPSNGMTLRVTLPPGTPCCEANALHRASLAQRVSDTINGYYEWVLDQAILPHQGIIFWWEAPPHRVVQAGPIILETEHESAYIAQPPAGGGA
jgi:hypothetical protein